MTTKVDLGKMMPDAEKRPLDKERTSDGDYTPQLIRTAANRHMTTSKSSSSTSLVPLFLVIILLAGTVFYIHRLEMRVRELEIIFRDMEGSNAFDITAAAAAAQSHSSQSADAVATESTPQPEVTEATTQRSPSLSPIVQLEGNYKDWEFLDDDAAGSGLDAVGYPPSDFHDDGIFSYDLEDDFDTNYEGSGDEPTSTVSSSSSGLKTSSGYLESYMNLLGYKWSEEEQTSRDPISVIHRRRRRSVAEPQPSEKVRDEKRDDEDEFADDDIMMADDAASAARGGSSDDRRTARGRSREGATHEEQPRDRNTDARTKTSSQKPTGVLAANDDSRQSRSRRNKMQYRKSVGRNQPLTSSTTTTVTTPSSGIKVAHFVAPRQDSPFVSKGMPPVTMSFWQADNWTSSMGSQNSFFDLSDGKVTILESGVYLIYAQILYHDASGRWAFGIYVDDSERLKCMNSEQLHRQHNAGDSGARVSATSEGAVHSIYQHCYTSGLLKLQRFDKISLRCLYSNKAIIMQPGFTFWGLVKLVSTDN